MNIYLLTLIGACPYDGYDAHVVAANDEQEARELCPMGDESGPFDYNARGFVRNPAWTNPARSTCDLIGTAIDGPPGVVLSSFNAG